MSSPPPLLKPNPARWLIVALLMGIAFLGHFNRVCMSVAGKAEFIGDDKLSEAQMGLVYSAFLFVYTLGMLPGGWLIDRLGPRLALAGMGLGLGFCSVLTGSLGWLGLSVTALWLPLLLVRGVAGASSVPLHPGAARSVSLWMPLAERSTANGMVTAGAAVGIACTYPVFGWLMDRLNWPGAFAVSGTALMAFGVLWYLLATDSGERSVSEPFRKPATLDECLGLLGNRSLVLLTLSYGALGYVQYMFFYWIEYYLGKELKLPDDQSRGATFLIMMAMALGMGGGGWVADRVCRWLGHGWGRRVVIIVGMGVCGISGMLGVLVGDTRLVIAFFALSQAALGMCEGVFWTAAPSVERRNAGLACALMNTGGNAAGMVAPTLTPILGQAFGWTTAIAVACALCAVGGLLWLGVRSGEEAPAGGSEGIQAVL